MEIVYELGYTKKRISNINQCRLFLQAITVSDITTVDGKYIEVNCYQHGRAKTNVNIGYTPEVQKPNKSVWYYWCKFIDTITHNNSRRLKTTLGEWIVPINNIRRKYNSYQD
jgi:hypothetical protein